MANIVGQLRDATLSEKQKELRDETLNAAERINAAAQRLDEIYRAQPRKAGKDEK